MPVHSLFLSGIVASDKSKPAVLESPWIFGNSIYQKTGLCLSFSYLLSTDSASSLSIILMTSSNSSIWELSGYQGQTWQTGLVSFTTNEDFKVWFIYSVWATQRAASFSVSLLLALQNSIDVFLIVTGRDCRRR